MIINLDKNKLIIKTNPLEDYIIRGLPIKKNNNEKKNFWTMNASLRNINILLDSFKNIQIGLSVQEFYNQEIDKKKEYDKKTNILKAVLNKTWKWPYEWLGTPYEHQKDMIMAGAAIDKLALLADCGTGKTLSIINIINYRKFIKKQIRRTLVICPRSIMKAAWEEDLEKFAPQMSFIILWHVNKKKRIEYLQQDKDIYIINFDGVKVIKNELIERGFDMVVLDESSKVKNHKSQVFKAINNVGSYAKYRYISTATPTPNSAQDAWAQFYFLDQGETLGNSFKDFEFDYFDRIDINNGIGEYVFSKFIPKPKAIEKLNKIIMQRSIRIKAENCLDLPEKKFIDRKISMTPKQESYYREMEEDLFTELEEEEIIEATNTLVKIMKLRQITSGFIMSAEDVPQGILLMPENENPKIQATDDLLEQIINSGNKAIIWAQFRMEIELLKERYRKKYGAVDFYGATSEKNRDKNINAFKNSPECSVLIAHPASLGHGVTLTVANSIIYYSLDYSYENYYQSSKRIDRIGQKQKTFYYHLVAENSIDEILMSTINRKESLQTILVDGIRNNKKMRHVMQKQKI
jgi:SNF2 family DNA or RNA helicase